MFDAIRDAGYGIRDERNAMRDSGFGIRDERSEISDQGSVAPEERSRFDIQVNPEVAPESLRTILGDARENTHKPKRRPESHTGRRYGRLMDEAPEMEALLAQWADLPFDGSANIDDSKMDDLRARTVTVLARIAGKVTA